MVNTIIFSSLVAIHKNIPFHKKMKCETLIPMLERVMHCCKMKPHYHSAATSLRSIFLLFAGAKPFSCNVFCAGFKINTATSAAVSPGNGSAGMRSEAERNRDAKALLDRLTAELQQTLRRIELSRRHSLRLCLNELRLVPHAERTNLLLRDAREGAFLHFSNDFL